MAARLGLLAVMLMLALVLLPHGVGGRDARTSTSSTQKRRKQQGSSSNTANGGSKRPPPPPETPPIAGRRRRGGGTGDDNNRREEDSRKNASSAVAVERRQNDEDPPRVRVHLESISSLSFARGTSFGSSWGGHGSMLLFAGPGHHQATALSAVQTISFCLGCPNPQEEGSLARGLRAALGPKDYNVIGEVVYAVPNDGSREIMNPQEVKGRVAIVNRGTVPMVEKIVRLQKTGAIAVLIVDHGNCDQSFDDCGYRAGSRKLGGFAPFDAPSMWREVTIPSLLVTTQGLARLRALMPLDEINIRGLGRQLVDAFVL